MPKYLINEGVRIPGVGNQRVEAADYRQEGDLIVFVDEQDKKVFTMRADTLATIKTID